MGVGYNFIGLNKEFNILGRENDNYPAFKMGPVLTDGSKESFVKICSRIKTKLLGFNVKQVDKSSILVSVDERITTAIPWKTSLNDGKNWGYSIISNGKGLIHLNNGNGNVKFGYYGISGQETYKLSDYEQYIKPTYPVPPADFKPTNPDSPANPNTGSQGNGTSSNTQQGQGSATASGSGGSGDGSLSVSEANSASAASAQSSASASESSASDSASASTSASSSQSVAKVIDIDEEVVKIAGIGILILLIIAVIALYYRNDIKSMIEKKNGK